MFRYLALLWNPNDSRELDKIQLLDRTIAERVPTLQRCFDGAGVRVFCSDVDGTGLKVYRTGGQSGVVLGRLFRRNKEINEDRAAEEGTFEPMDDDRLAVSKGRSLITDYWGNYVAILIDKSSAFKRIVKDPTGSLPCFHTTWQRVDIIFSCLGDCIDLRILPFTVNWSYVASSVARGGFEHRLNPLNEVSEIHRGECREIESDGSSSTRLYWQPTSFADRACIIDDPSAAAAALHATVRSATGTLARTHGTILLRLSGGLDSSIISGCLKDTRPRPAVTSYTYFAPDGRSDERRWARLAADYAGSEHLELPMDPLNVRLDSLTNVRPSVEPVSAFTHLKSGEMERLIAENHDFTAVFTGDGGDSVLGASSIATAVDDFIRMRGLSKGLLNLASHVALKTDSLVWTVLRAAIRRRLLRSGVGDYGDKLLFGTTLATANAPGVKLNCGSVSHPWFAECSEAPWHVITRVGNLIASPDFYDAFMAPAGFSPILVSPLYSQPVVELSLRIPTFIHFEEGRARGLARLAFANEVPAPILRRQWKDRSPRAFDEIVRRNRNFIREVLLGGSLCNHRLLDRNAIDSALSSDFHTEKVRPGELLRYINMELWLRHFVERSAEKLAA